MIVLKNYRFRSKKALFDTMIAHYVLQLNSVTEWIILPKSIYVIRQSILMNSSEPKEKIRKMRDLAPEDVYRYACERCGRNPETEKYIGKGIKGE